MAPPRRRARLRVRALVVRAVAGTIVATLALLAAGLLWPPPDGLAPLTCTRADGPRCVAASGRVLYVPRKDRGDPRRPMHLLLLSRDSVAAPAVTLVKVPVGLRPAHAPSVGTWVSVRGTTHEGSHGFTDIGATRIVVAR